MTDYMICQNQDNHLLYALKHGRFWFWNKHQNKWVPSDFAAQQYAKAQTKEPDLAQEDWLWDVLWQKRIRERHWMPTAMWQVRLPLTTIMVAIRQPDGDMDLWLL